MKPPPAAAPSTVPVPRMLGAFALGAVVAVLAVPALGALVAGGGEAGLAVFVLTWAAVVGVSGAYLFPMSVVLGFSREWFRFGLGCLAALELILFVLMPVTFTGRGIGNFEYVVVGFVSLLLALLVFGQIAKAARRYLPPKGWTTGAKIGIAVLAGIAGQLAQLAMASLMGEDPVSSVLGERGILIAVTAGLSGYSLAEAFDRATRPPLVAAEGRGLIARTIAIGVALLVVLHLAWFVYLTRIF